MSDNHVTLSSIFTTNLIKIDSWLIPRCRGTPLEIRQKQELVAKWIDHLGQGSTRAQGLNSQLTTSEKFMKTPDQQIYAYISKEANNGTGQMIGFLRTGRKSLYFHKESGQVTQKYPDCVLDFYVTEAFQRHGIGKILYDFMLQDKKVAPHTLAIDKPSPKMLSFLNKNYGLRDLRVYANNYAVVPQFFDGPSERAPIAANTPSPIGRFAAHRPKSEIESVLYGDN